MENSINFPVKIESKECSTNQKIHEKIVWQRKSAANVKGKNEDFGIDWEIPVKFVCLECTRCKGTSRFG